jgi:hypothetical protein
MSASYPSAIKTFAARSAGQTIDPSHVNDLQDEVNAIETALVTGPITLQASTIATLSVTGASTFAGIATYSHATPIVLTSTGGGIKERNRSVQLGEWQAFAFSAGNFTGNGTQTWTVDDADETIRYTLVGKTLTILFLINSTTVGGVANTELRLTLPGSMTVGTLDAYAAVQISDNGGSFQTGLARAVGGATYVAFYKDMTTNSNWTAATNQTSIHGQITLEIA